MNQTASFFDLNPATSLSAGHDRMVVFARRKNGALAHIDGVENGKACECICLACGEVMIARQGEVREHSFAHQSGRQCDHALEVMLHVLAAELISQRGRFVAPPLRVEASVKGPFGKIADRLIQPAVQVPVDSVRVERSLTSRRPSIVATVKGRDLRIHVALEHKVGDAERRALAEHDQAAIEIDLSKGAASTMGELGQLLFGADVRKSWLYNRREQALRETLLAALKRKADEQWLEHRQVLRDLSMRRERERNALVQRHAANRSNDEGHLIQGLVVADAVDQSTQSLPDLRNPRRKEGSPTIEYASPDGRIWLLHSTHPDIHFTADSGVRAALRVLLRHGAVAKDIAGRYTITPEGWSAACVELAGSWLSVRSVAGVASTEVEGSDLIQVRPHSDGAP